MLLDACEAADMTPVPVMRLHAFAFLANLLAPVWSLRSHDGKILKRRGGPYYPDLQHELDILVGLGLVTVSGMTYVAEEGTCRLEGSFHLISERADPLIEHIKIFSDESGMSYFLRRLAFSLKRVQTPVEKLIAFDATWADDRTGTGDVIDFSEWKAANYTAYAASYFAKVAIPGFEPRQGERLQLYVHLLERRAHG